MCFVLMLGVFSANFQIMSKRALLLLITLFACLCRAHGGQALGHVVSLNTEYVVITGTICDVNLEL